MNMYTRMHIILLSSTISLANIVNVYAYDLKTGSFKRNCVSTSSGTARTLIRRQLSRGKSKIGKNVLNFYNSGVSSIIEVIVSELVV